MPARRTPAQTARKTRLSLPEGKLPQGQRANAEEACKLIVRHLPFPHKQDPLFLPYTPLGNCHRPPSPIIGLGSLAYHEMGFGNVNPLVAQEEKGTGRIRPLPPSLWASPFRSCLNDGKNRGTKGHKTGWANVLRQTPWDSQRKNSGFEPAEFRPIGKGTA